MMSSRPRKEKAANTEYRAETLHTTSRFADQHVPLLGLRSGACQGP